MSPSIPLKCTSGIGLDGRPQRADVYRWAVGDPARFRRYAEELVALAPDVIVAQGTVAAGPLLQATRTLPIVFVNATDPVGNGLVESLARPGRNAKVIRAANIKAE
jgi:putative tryptophan/tyrosine transport system substrate-binding protein